MFFLLGSRRKENQERDLDSPLNRFFAEKEEESLEKEYLFFGVSFNRVRGN